jgi:hypothetical protein
MKHEDFGRDRRCRSATLVAATYLNFSSKTKLTYNAITTQYSLWLVLIYKLGRVDIQSVSQLKNGGEVGFDLIRFDIDQCSLGDTRCFGKLSLRHKSFAPCRFHASSQSHPDDYRQWVSSYELFTKQHATLAHILPIYFL